jgi:hypothetical protein
MGKFTRTMFAQDLRRKMAPLLVAEGLPLDQETVP